MIAMYFFLSSLIRKLRIGVKDREFRGIFYSVVGLLAIGTLFYHQVEGWSLVDAFYFTVIALATVGFGDFAPVTTLGKLFTVVYLIVGLGLLSSFIVRLWEIGRENERPLQTLANNLTSSPSRDRVTEEPTARDGE